MSPAQIENMPRPKPAARLATALIAAQVELRAPTKNRAVSVRSGRENYDFAYATLDTIVEQVLRPVLPVYGLWFMQHMAVDERGHVLVTEILHKSGESKRCPIAMPDMPSSPHEAGSLISYFKRYGLCAAFGLVAEDDDDARLAEARVDRTISEAQMRELERLADNAPTEIERLCRYMKVDTLATLPAAKFERARSALQVRRAA